MLVDRRDRRIGFVERRECLFGGVLAVRLLREGTRQCGGKLTHLSLGGDEFASGLVDFAGDLQRAGLAAGTAIHPARTHQIAVASHRAQPRPSRDHIQGGTDIVDDGDSGQHGRHRALQSRRRLDQIDGPPGTLGKHTTVLAGGHRPVGQHDRRAAAVNLLERPHRCSGRAEIIGRHCVGRGTEHRRQRCLITGLHFHQFSNGAEKPCATAVFHQPRRAVAPLQAHREGVDAGL